MRFFAKMEKFSTFGKIGEFGEKKVLFEKSSQKASLTKLEGGHYSGGLNYCDSAILIPSTKS